MARTAPTARISIDFRHDGAVRNVEAEVIADGKAGRDVAALAALGYDPADVTVLRVMGAGMRRRALGASYVALSDPTLGIDPARVVRG